MGNKKGSLAAGILTGGASMQTRDIAKKAGYTPTSDKKTKENEKRAESEAKEKVRVKAEKDAEEKRRKRMNIFRAEEGDVVVGGNRSSIFGN